jgi:hypothetical protein
MSCGRDSDENGQICSYLVFLTKTAKRQFMDRPNIRVTSRPLNRLKESSSLGKSFNFSSGAWTDALVAYSVRSVFEEGRKLTSVLSLEGFRLL